MTDRLRRWGRLVVVDITPLRRVPGYRWFFAGMFFMRSGRQLAVVAIPFQVYELTGSTLAVGLLGLAQLVPLLLISPVGGAIADSFDRRRVIIVTQLLLAVTAGGLVWNSLLEHPAVWPLFALSALTAGMSAIDNPTRTALIPGLVGRGLLPSSMALNQTLGNVAQAGIPALGGLLIATTGLPFTYALQAMVAVVSAWLVLGIPRQETEGGGRSFGISSIVEGLRYLRSNKVIQSTFVIDLNAMVFGMPTALFPAIGTSLFHGDAFTVGLLFAAPGAGALIAALTSGWVSEVRRQGIAVIMAVVVWGVAITVFGITSLLPLALVMLAVAGGADVVSAIYRGTIVQLSVPDSLRGRLTSIHGAVVGGGPRLGDLEAGVVASLTSVRFSVVSGGIACVLGALAVSRWVPQLAGYVYEAEEPGGRQ